MQHNFSACGHRVLVDTHQWGKAVLLQQFITSKLGWWKLCKALEVLLQPHAWSQCIAGHIVAVQWWRLDCLLKTAKATTHGSFCSLARMPQELGKTERELRYLQASHLQGDYMANFAKKGCARVWNVRKATYTIHVEIRTYTIHVEIRPMLKLVSSTEICKITWSDAIFLKSSLKILWELELQGFQVANNSIEVNLTQLQDTPICKIYPAKYEFKHAWRWYLQGKP